MFSNQTINLTRFLVFWKNYFKFALNVLTAINIFIFLIQNGRVSILIKNHMTKWGHEFVLSIFLSREESYISLLWLIKYILFYGVVRVNLYSEIDTYPSESPWLIKNFQSERYILPQKSELSV